MGDDKWFSVVIYAKTLTLTIQSMSRRINRKLLTTQYRVRANGQTGAAAIPAQITTANTQNCHPNLSSYHNRNEGRRCSREERGGILVLSGTSNSQGCLETDQLRTPPAAWGSQILYIYKCLVKMTDTPTPRHLRNEK